MRIRPSDLWRWGGGGGVDRSTYWFWGVALTIVKYLLDRALVQALVGKPWSPLNYWVPGDVFGVLSDDPDHRQAFWPMVALALPFIYVGVTLTLRRLRDAYLPEWLVMLFFVPVVNLILFVILGVLPSRAGPRLRKEDTDGTVLGWYIPRGKLGSATAALVLTVVPALGIAAFGATALGEYGWGLFIGIPFVVGFVSAVLHGYHEPRSIWDSLSVSFVAMGLLGLGLFALAVEGLICILMAAPIALALSSFGAVVGHMLHAWIDTQSDHARLSAALFALLPALMGAEALIDAEPAVREVTTSIEIDEPPEKVWENVIAFSELPPPREGWFKAGIAYPLRARIDGRGAGAVRRCEFSTGAFVEPIEVWDEPWRLAFGVSAQPPVMEEMMLWPGLQPAHVDRYLVSRAGEFRLTALEGGRRTRLEGTTWYTHRMWPAQYWGFWSDGIIHAIHLRVLEHIRGLSER
ncbi:MAG TPA: DUF805 domain-containing protein [Planctomycetota bacterium]|nr:DUF805 domain-containing protein [Planctomycetota bacterium]